MKKLIITFIAVLSFTLTNAQSKIIKTAPIANAIGIYNAGFETKFKEKTSFELKAYYFNIFDIKAYKIDVMHNWYTKESLKDFHFGAGAGVFGGDFTTIGYDSSSNKESLTIPLLKINAGYQWILGEHFAIDPTLAYTYLMTNNDISEGGGFTIGFAVGYAW